MERLTKTDSHCVDLRTLLSIALQILFIFHLEVQRTDITKVLMKPDWIVELTFHTLGTDCD